MVAEGKKLFAAWTKVEAAASPTPAEAARKGKPGGSWQQARPQTKVERLQAQVLLFEGEPETFSDDMLASARASLEAARAEKDGGKPTLL